MSYDIRKPMITESTERGQLLQIKSYLIQLVDQLNFALRALERGAGNASTTEGEPSLKLTAGLFSEIKSLIMKSSDIINAYYEKMEPKFGEKIEEHNTAEDSHADIRELIKKLTETLDTFEDGEDGVSPTVEVSKTGSVTTIAITDVNGTKTATINDGAKGDKGEKGDKGDTGLQGEQGIQGIQGEKGDKGETGNTGPQGPKGDTGETGPAGPAGATGATGPQGPKGDTGATGRQGPTGDAGAAASNGSNGASCTNSWNGTTLTVTSASGTSSANLKGDKGDTGATGATGAQGPKGDTGATGETGPQGPKGDTGATGAAGKTPVKGTDYYTAADKAEMVNMVLASLPTWNGGSY